MKRTICIAFIVVFASFCNNCITQSPEYLNVAVLGLGGRVQGLVLGCLRLQNEVHKKIRVVAVCDTYAQDSFNLFMNVKSRQRDWVTQEYEDMMSQASFYPDTHDGLQELFKNHTNIDRILITSANDRHYAHLQSALAHSHCKQIFIEKPIFKSITDYTAFNGDTSGHMIDVGLVLRYSNMAKEAVRKLKEYKSALGQLRKVSSWEHVKFGHSLSIIMMNWRRHRSVSGGLLIEKAVHDLDLALFFMAALDVIPQTLSITTQTAHEFYKKSRQEEIIDRLENDAELRAKAQLWDTFTWRRLIPFSYDVAGSIDWRSTMHSFFKGFPADADLDASDIIPDRHLLKAAIQTTQGNSIDFELDVKLDDFALESQRGIHLMFDKGTIIIDVEHGHMSITLNDAIAEEFDLGVNGHAHSGGDLFVAHAILGSLPHGQYKATFDDPVVQLSTVMALASEEQAVNKNGGCVQLTQKDGRWIITKSDQDNSK